MKFEKRLIILTGERDSKGTLKAERNAYGVRGSLSCDRLPALSGGKYVLALKENERVQTFDLGKNPALCAALQIDEAFDLCRVHAVVYAETHKKEAVLYGTLNNLRIWKGNWLDGLGDKKNEEKVLGAAVAPPQPDTADTFRYSERAKAFSSLFPQIENAYRDDAIAEVNYYAGTALDPGAAETPPPRQTDDPPADMSGDQSADMSGRERAYVESYLHKLTADNRQAAAARAQGERQAAPTPSELQAGYINLYLDKAERDGRHSVEAASHGLPRRLRPPEEGGTFRQPPEGTDAAPPLGRPIYFRRAGWVFPRDPGAGTPRPDNMYAAPDGQAAPPPCGINGGTVSPPPPIENADSAAPGPTPAPPDVPDVPAVPDVPDVPSGAGIRTAAEDGGSVVPPKPDQNAAAKLKGRKLSFYEQVQGQIDKLFETGARETALETLMPFTKWVRVDHEGRGRYYVVGIIGEKPDFICYGIPAAYTPKPPEELDGYCQWLPLDAKAPQGEGYWLLYQDAATGESVE
jgi:hypothetical protein